MISRGRASVCTRTCVHVQTNRKKHAHVRKTWGTCGCAQKKTGWWTVPDEKKQPRHGKVYPQSRTFFSRNGKKSLKKSVPPPEKIPDFPDLFPWNGQFYVIQRTKIFQESPFFANRRTKISQERPVLCQPKDKNFARKTIFCQQKDKNFPKTASSAPAGRRKKWIQRPFSFARLGNPDQNSSPERQKIRKKFPEKLETELHVHKQNRNFSMQHGKWRHGNPVPQGHFYTGRPAFFMFPCRETYVLPGGNLCFPTGKPTVSTPET